MTGLPCFNKIYCKVVFFMPRYQYNDWFIQKLAELFEGVLTADPSQTNEALAEIQRGYDWADDVHPELINISIKFITLIKLYQKLQLTQQPIKPLTTTSATPNWLTSVHPIETIDFSELEEKLAKRRKMLEETTGTT
jgi:hypothetical protein